MGLTIKLRGDTAANWAAADPVLAAREVGLDITNLNFRVGDGASAWSALAEWIAGGNINIIILQDQKTSGTHGGTFTSGAWRTRDINTIVFDDTGDVSVSNNKFTLPPGTYVCLALAPARQVAENQARLYDVSNSEVVIVGANAHSQNNSSGTQIYSTIVGSFEIVQSTEFEIQHRCRETVVTNGFGLSVGSQFTVEYEVYTSVILFKVV